MTQCSRNERFLQKNEEKNSPPTSSKENYRKSENFKKLRQFRLTEWTLSKNLKNKFPQQKVLVIDIAGNKMKNNSATRFTWF